MSGHGNQVQNKPRAFSLKRAQTARLRRLEIRRMNTDNNNNNNSEGGGGRAISAAAGDFSGKKRRMRTKKVPSRETSAGKCSKVDDGVASDPSENVIPSPELDSPPPPPPVVIPETGSDGRENGEEEDEVDSSTPTCVSHGYMSIAGRTRSMEDAVTVEPVIGEGGDFSFFAVYDGHGGSRVSEACHDRLHKLLVDELKSCNSADVNGGGSTVGIDWEKVMTACFAKMDDEVNITDGVGFSEDELSLAVPKNGVGSTAVVVLVGREEVVVANCGDSRAVLYRGGQAVPLSFDHKADRPDEQRRVEAMGGRIINWHGSRVLGVLATSRSIGDHYLKPYMSSQPEVTVNKRTKLDNFIIIASDGLWDVLSNEEACGIVKRCLSGPLRRRVVSRGSGVSAVAALILVELAMSRGSTDNISVIIVELNRSK